MVDSQTTSSIRFNNLSLLLKNMKSLKMTLETFSFRFNNVLTPAVKSVQLNLGDFSYAA